MEKAKEIQLIDYHQLIMQGMRHLNELTRLDCLWLSPIHDKNHAISSNPLPPLLDFASTKHLSEIKALCTKSKPPRFCIASTASTLEFLFIPLIFQSEDQGLVRIGPFLTSPMDHQRFSALMHSLRIPLKEHMTLHRYYESLTLIANQTDINLGHICMNLFGYTLPLTKSVRYEEATTTLKSMVKTEAQTYSLNFIEERYSFEHKLRHAIAASDRILLDETIDFFTHKNIMSDRYPDNPLRSAKNLAIVTNTILRHAAEDGGLQPFYLHEISTKYALLIEQAQTRTSLNQLQTQMFDDYFDYVNKYAYHSNSPFIRKVIQRIRLNLEDPLSLRSLAEEFQMKPSNLANQFKKETGYTVSEFINHLRIENACYYLKNSQLSIHSICCLVGYNDANYFSRIFRKLKGESPSAFR
ncbi:MAG: helix-turn-helix transcriptional regulator [Vallitaleaceae bacterium]|nr:helix-turn-helix transcriptional regulator [Vallitaleaceae bacterium]